LLLEVRYRDGEIDRPMRERVERVVLTYSDERGIARYELPLTPAPEGMPFSAGPPFRQERRIK
jgi:hypothetical protein